jgi:hypothetical protein
MVKKIQTLETACRSPGGQPRKIAAGKFYLARNPAGKIFLPEKTLADGVFREVASKITTANNHRQVAMPENRTGNIALAGKKFGEILRRKKPRG